MQRLIDDKGLHLLKFAGVIASILIFVYSTFATMKYVDEKHESVVGILTDIQSRVQNVETLLMERKK